MEGEEHILPPTTITDAEWVEDPKDALLVAHAKEMGVLLLIHACDRNSGTTTISITTGMTLTTQGWAALGTLKTITVDITEFPDCTWVYFAGPGQGGTNQPGFGKYVRISVSQASGASINIEVKAILKG